MKFTLNQFLIAAASVIFLVLVTGWLWSNHKIAKLEREVGDAKAAALETQRTAGEKEKESGEYKAKIDYLEQERDALNATRQKQDEELKKLSATVDNARRDVRRTRGVRTKPATVDELCAKLAELGHACQ